MSRPPRPVVSADVPTRLFHTTALLIALILVVPLPGLASGIEPIGLATAVQAALARSQALSAQAAAARSAREAAVAAGERPDPVLRLSLENLPIEGEDRFSTTRDFMTSKSVSLAQTLPSLANRQSRTQRFETEAQLALATRA
ncbi:MAG: TolC family protein, partial [Hydrogenophaga sp.]|nr:TolC family protein [Hydrogenophaga sp.]